MNPNRVIPHKEINRDIQILISTFFMQIKGSHNPRYYMKITHKQKKRKERRGGSVK